MTKIKRKTNKQKKNEENNLNKVKEKPKIKGKRLNFDKNNQNSSLHLSFINLKGKNTSMDLHSQI